ncbi:MAG: bifunctional 4-hydroxy-2-oxoglutarate aldolase/2-dehydro-3-deoxy-phosphogluconate aldolase [Bryobacterales bacterium]|nr:bifunctional 4-hydroxy-2-oxoglutarate aldolase/2-dehydro-3-deoxy-phosphogluconate aldolase [Bryobacterales bacterium]
MAKQDVLNTILNSGIIPIVRTDTAEHALDAIKVIHGAGIPVLEVTMTVPGALKILEKACDEFGDSLILGAGTVLDATTARHCMLAGAEFCVTPSLDVETIEICNRYSKCVVPGALTPTEIMTAWNAGATLVKVFPVAALGGPRYIKALKAPLPQVPLVPTGGVNLRNASAFFEAGASAVAVGSELVNKHWLVDCQFERIETAARGFLDIVAESRAA